MDEQKYMRMEKRRHIIFLTIVVMSVFLSVAFFNFHHLIVDISGTYNAVCLTPDNKHAQIVQDVLYFVMPKLFGHCATIPVAEYLGQIPPGQQDLIIIFDLTTFALPFLTGPCFFFHYKVFYFVIKRAYTRGIRTVRYFRARGVLFMIGSNATSFWFVLFAPIEVPAPTGPFSLTNLMTPYGGGVLFYSLCGSMLPWILAVTLAMLWLMVDPKQRALMRNERNSNGRT